MPNYQFISEDETEIIEQYQKLDEDHSHVIVNGKRYNRLFHAPNAAVDSVIKDPFNSKEFVAKTANKKETYGDILDRSKEMSEKRASKDGVDIQKQKYMEQWSRERNGRKFPTWTL